MVTFGCGRRIYLGLLEHQLRAGARLGPCPRLRVGGAAAVLELRKQSFGVEQTGGVARAGSQALCAWRPSHHGKLPRRHRIDGLREPR